jgi:hypothetical protein
MGGPSQSYIEWLVIAMHLTCRWLGITMQVLPRPAIAMAAGLDVEIAEDIRATLVPICAIT